MPGSIRFQGSLLALAGRKVRVGFRAPSFTVTSQDMKDAGLSDFAGKTKLISSFPSLDTPVCDLQVKEFNKRALSLSPDIAVVGISMDLHFAQKRFCSENSIKNETVLSDYKTRSFGINYSLLIKDLNLLARAVLIIDKNDILRYLQIVDELTNPPRYDEAVRALEDVLKNPSLDSKGLSGCVPCKIGAPPMSDENIRKALASCRGWELIENRKISKEFKFSDFRGVSSLFDVISVIAETEGHHPVMTAGYNRLKVTLTTHASGGLTENDFMMAGIIDGASGE